MATLNNIFTVKQKNQFTYECINTNANTSRLTLIDKINTNIYIYKDLQLHIDKNNQCTYIKINNEDHHQHNNILIQTLSIYPACFTTFPLINKYDNIIFRQTKIYYDNATKININLVCDVPANNKKEQISYVQINGDITFENIIKLLNNIFNL